MRMLRAMLSAVLAVNFAHAEPVVTAVVNNPTDESKPPYLQIGRDDDGYIAITARVGLPNGASCVTPTNLGKSDNFFVKNNLEVVLIAFVEGFQGIDAKQPIPIAAYKFDDAEGKYCAAPFTLPITLVPNHRFGRRGPTGAPHPRITVKLVYTAKGQELVTPIVMSWINVAAAVSTGGAAQTVVGISKLASSKAVGALTEVYNARSQNRAEQVFPIHLPWTALVNGPSATKVSFYETGTKWGESVENAIARVRAKPDSPGIKSVFDLQLSYEYRRSLFLEDNDFDATTTLPTTIDSRLSSAHVLNFPSRDSTVNVVFPNLTQVLGSTSPSIAQAIISGDASKCDDAFVTLRGLGLNAFDRAVVMDALLEGGNQLRKKGDFIAGCFSSEPEAFNMLARMYGPGRYPPSIGFGNRSLLPIAGDNLIIEDQYLNRVTEIRSALTVKLPIEEKMKLLRTALGASSRIAWGGDFVGPEAQLDQQISTLAGLKFDSTSCIYRLSAQPGPANDYRIFMLARLGSAAIANKPEIYLAALDFSNVEPYAVTGMQLRSVNSDENANNHFDYIKRFSFEENSFCKKLLAQMT